MTISAGQAIAARRGLRLSQDELALLAGVPVGTLAEFEQGEAQPQLAIRAAIRAALESRGALFTPDNGVSLSWAALASRKPQAGIA